ncbi:hypothetical protein FAES_0376 [Fibrella aestuarina BUZ 2]|uniref:Uncharacterized protein n=1 Tax=Fibrella aestuarina BUZ 2 TaxID=1166018 RepID=I0K2N5_9BACT|nr:hypothetical protein FAES_0376 [Fibrella aestuarina BUZ 2]
MLYKKPGQVGRAFCQLWARLGTLLMASVGSINLQPADYQYASGARGGAL